MELTGLKKILEDDTLIVLLLLPNILTKHRVFKKISYFCIGFFVLTVVWVISTIVCTTKWNFFLTQYAILASGTVMTFASYVTMYHPTYLKLYFDTYNNIFPFLWPLRSLGESEYLRFQKLAKITTTMAWVGVSVTVLAGILSLPCFVDGYRFMFPVKIAFDYLNGWMLYLYVTLFYVMLYHGGMTIVATLYCLTYVVMHLYNQVCLLNKKLTELPEKEDAFQAVGDYEYQNLVTSELISCIKLHQVLVEFSRKINEWIYFPTFYYTTSVVLVALNLLLFPKDDSKFVFFMVVALCILAVFMVISCCCVGQLLENESEKLFVSGYNCKWYLWNVKNRKLLQMFLVNTREGMALTSSGLVTINFQLLIGLYRAVYSTLMFFLNMSKSIVAN
ncbi:hypothetical protein Zmor_004692 [Zophobas morio]|uniref:Odorant receptor n=1 Tax=Zophobas morio TaxID=2755281 RepID=A0AA38MLJ7_9CUCU|nr:hypothetical protein Zmor_004692 [Zophobas morio]